MSYTEATANGLAVMAYPLYHALALRKPTPLQLVWAVQLVAQYIGCIEHSGYDGLHPLIVSPSRFPSWMLSTTRHHDTHHRLMRGNYGGYLKVWDVLMGTAIVEDADGTAAAAAASQSRKQNQRRNPQASRRSPRRAKPKLRTS